MTINERVKEIVRKYYGELGAMEDEITELCRTVHEEALSEAIEEAKKSYCFCGERIRSIKEGRA